MISVGNCGLYAGPWGVRVEDTNWVKTDGYETLTDFERVLVGRRLDLAEESSPGRVLA